MLHTVTTEPSYGATGEQWAATLAVPVLATLFGAEALREVMFGRFYYELFILFPLWVLCGLVSGAVAIRLTWWPPRVVEETPTLHRAAVWLAWSGAALLLTAAILPKQTSGC